MQWLSASALRGGYTQEKYLREDGGEVVPVDWLLHEGVEEAGGGVEGGVGDLDGEVVGFDAAEHGDGGEGDVLVGDVALLQSCQALARLADGVDYTLVASLRMIQSSSSEKRAWMSHFSSYMCMTVLGKYSRRRTIL